MSAERRVLVGLDLLALEAEAETTGTGADEEVHP
jgi:hypothetical protein